MAQPAATFRALHQGPDPRAADPGSLLQAYSPTNNALLAADLFRQSTNCHEPLVFLGHSTAMNGPMPLIAPFSLDTPGGPNNTGETYAMVGDIGDTGVHPSLVVIDDTVFDRVQNVTVPSLATTRAAWDALPDADNFISVPAANTVQVTVRHLVPIPHPYIAPILQAYVNDELSWRWTIVNVLEPIQADNAQQQAYNTFLQWLRAASTLRPADQRPMVHMDFAGVYGRPRITQALPTILARYLPGLRTPSTIQNSMTQLVQHQQDLATQLARVAQPRDKTLMDINPVLAQNALKVSEQSQLANLTPFWQNLHLVQKTGVLAALQQAVSASDYPPALLSPSFATDFIGCRWVAPNGSAVDQGITLTRMSTYASGPDFVTRHAQTTTAFNIMEVYNSSGAELVRMVLTDGAAGLPRNTVELTAVVQACYGFMEQIWGAQPSHVTAFRTHLVNPLHQIVQMILRDYYSYQHEVCLKITIYIFRHMNACYHNLITGALPTAANPQPTPQAPPYGAIHDALLAGNIRSLVDLPEGLLRPPTVPAPMPAAARAPTAPATSATRAPAPAVATDTSRHPVHGDANWNESLRAAWTATGHRALFPKGAPFFRANAPPKNRVVLKRLAGDRSQPICLKMCLTNECMSNCKQYHGQLTPEEAQSVAREGGFSL